MMNQTKSIVTLYTGKTLIYNENMSCIKRDKVAMKPLKNDSKAEGRGFDTPFPLTENKGVKRV
jgi:hypothetical protein